MDEIADGFAILFVCLVVVLVLIAVLPFLVRPVVALWVYSWRHAAGSW